MGHPHAPIVPRLPLAAFGLYAHFDYVGSQLLLAHFPTGMAPSADELERSGLWQVLGGTLLVSAAWPWRWTGRPAPAFRPDRGTLGVLVGVVAFADLWYLIQLANPVGFVTVVFAAHLPYVFDLILLPQLAAAAVLGTLAAARWVSPIAAAIAGLPLLVTGLLLVLVPVDAGHGIARFVWSSRAIELGVGQSVGLGAFLLFGGATGDLGRPTLALAPAVILPGARGGGRCAGQRGGLRRRHHRRRAGASAPWCRAPAGAVPGCPSRHRPTVSSSSTSGTNMGGPSGSRRQSIIRSLRSATASRTSRSVRKSGTRSASRSASLRSLSGVGRSSSGGTPSLRT